MLYAKIKNFSYIKSFGQDLERYDFDNINDLPSKCIVNFENKIFLSLKQLFQNITIKKGV